jgi:hypothetical protein
LECITHLYLSEDILQGESVPFFITWEKACISQLDLSVTGFAGVLKLYNVFDEETMISSGRVRGSDLKVQGYLGGVLGTRPSADPYQEGALELVVTYDDGKVERLKERRVLHTTRAKLAAMPDRMSLPLGDNVATVEIDLEGRSTVIVEIEKEKGDVIDIALPNEIQTAMESFTKFILDGLDGLRTEYPMHKDFIDTVLEIKPDTSFREYLDTVSSKIESIRSDRPFIEAISMIYVAAFLGQSSLRDSLLLPLMEYFESTAAIKAFLRSPFLCAKVPAGGGTLSCRVVIRDLLENVCGDPISVKVWIESDRQMNVPLKDIILLRRI